MCTRVRWRGLAFERCANLVTYSGADGQGLCDDHAMAQVRLYGLETLCPGDRPRFAADHFTLLVGMERQGWSRHTPQRHGVLRSEGSRLTT